MKAEITLPLCNKASLSPEEALWIVKAQIQIFGFSRRCSFMLNCGFLFP